MIVRPVSDVVYILRQPHGWKEIMLHHNLLKRYVPREQRLVPLDTSDQDISLGGDVKEHGIHDWDVELESEEDSQDEIPRGSQDLERRHDSYEIPGLRRSTQGRVRPRRLDDYALDFGEDSHVISH